MKFHTLTFLILLGFFQVNATVSPIVGPASTCVGSPINLSDSSIGGFWSSFDTTVIAYSYSTGMVVGLSTGTAVITYTVGTEFVTKTITVNSALNTISGLSAVCEGATLSLTDATTGGTWSSSNSNATVNTSTGVVSGISHGSVLISYSMGSCITTKLLTVNPSGGVLYGCDNVGVGDSIIFKGVCPASWSVSDTNIAVITTGGVVRGISTGTTVVNSVLITGCTGPALTITVTPSTVIRAITGVNMSCIGQTVSVSESVTGGTWSVSDTNLASINNVGIVNTRSEGITTITYTKIGYSCTELFIINPLPVPLGGPANVCRGDTIVLGTKTLGGYFYSSCGIESINGYSDYGTFTCSDTGKVKLGLQSYGGSINGIAYFEYVKGLRGGNDTITFTDNLTGCKVSTVTTVDTPLVLNSISGSSNICTGSTGTLGNATTCGTWSSGNVLIATINSATGVVTGVDTGMTTITYNATNSCGSEIVSKSISIVSPPNAGTITGTTGVCESATAIINATVTGGTWSATNNSVTVLGTGTSCTIYGNAPGYDTINYVVAGMYCNGKSSKIISVNPQPTVVAITGPNTICVGNSMTLSELVTNGTWGSSNTHAVVSVSGQVTGISGGIDSIIYSVSNTCGTRNAFYVITVNAVPILDSITGTSFVCLGSTVSLNEITTGGTWHSADSSIATVSGGIVTGISQSVTAIIYSKSNLCGTNYVFHLLTVNPLSNAGTIEGSDSVCVGGSLTFSDTTAIGIGNWSFSNSNALVYLGYVTALSAGIDTLIYTATSVCGTTTTTRTIFVNPQPDAGIITGDSTVCVNATLTLSDTNHGTGSLFWSHSDTTASVLGGTVTGITEGVDTIKLAIYNSCGYAETTKTITVTPLPYAGLVSGTGILVVGVTYTFADSTAGGIWTSGNGKVELTPITHGCLVKGVATGLDTVTYSVTNSCGTAKANNPVTINPIPAIGVITGADTLCVGSTITLLDTTAGGTWSETNGITVVTGGIVTALASGTDTIKYTVMVSGVPVVQTHLVVVIPMPNAGTITGVDSVCIGNFVPLLDWATGGNWSVTNTNVSLTPYTTGVTANGVATGVDTVIYSVTNFCGTNRDSFTIAIQTIPSPVLSGIGYVCIGKNDTLATTIAGGVWSSANGNASVNTDGIVTGTTAGFDFIIYNVSNNCGTGNTVFTIHIYTKHQCDSIMYVEPITLPADFPAYPNPTAGTFNIQLSNEVHDGVIEIIDVYGHITLQNSFSIDNQGEHKLNIDLNALTDGNYWIKIVSEKEVITGKVTLKR